MTPWNDGTRVDVVLIEDHDDYRTSLEFLLNSDAHIRCRSFADAELGLAHVHLHRPEVVIMDIRLPGMDGIACTRRIKESYPGIEVVICTMHEDDALIFEALRAGASGYLLKRSPIEDLMEAIRQVLAGGSPMSPAIARRVVSSFQPKRDKGIDDLSEREQEVLDLLSKGLTAKEIGEQLFVSANTIRTHIRHIYEKLHVKTRVEAVRKGGK